MNPDQWKDDERFVLALDLVESASRLARRQQDQLQGDSFRKADASPVTVVDLAIQTLVTLRLKERFPEDQLVAEETAEPLRRDEGMLKAVCELIEPVLGRRSGDEVLESFEALAGESEPAWVLDPIDGTKGFLRGDQFAIALALRQEGRIRFGLLGCPRLGPGGCEPGPGVLGVAYRGRGSWQRSLDETSWHPIQVSSCQDVKEARLLRSFEASHTNEGTIDGLVQTLSIAAEPIRMDSLAKYLLVARGDGEAIVRGVSQPGYKEKVWDQAAGDLMVAEAGGAVTDLHGQPLDFSLGDRLEANTGVLASNGLLHRELVQGLAQG